MERKKIVFVLIGLVLVFGLIGSLYAVKWRGEIARTPINKEPPIFQEPISTDEVELGQSDDEATGDETADALSSDVAEMPQGGADLDIIKPVFFVILATLLAEYIQSTKKRFDLEVD